PSACLLHAPPSPAVHTLSLHDALPISRDPGPVLRPARQRGRRHGPALRRPRRRASGRRDPAADPRFPRTQQLRRALPRQGADARGAAEDSRDPGRARAAGRDRRRQLVPRPDPARRDRVNGCRRPQTPPRRTPASTTPISVRGRTTMRHRKSMLSTAIALGLGLAAQAHAQQAPAQPATDEAAVELDRVVVTGIRASLQQALDTKRNADAIIDVVTAEDVGKFPSTNVAEAISSLPGITIDKAFGQGEKISILGTDPALSRTLLNGQTVASAD